MHQAVEQIQKQFIELQGALSETSSQIKVTEANIIALEAERRRQEITVREVNAEHNAESKMYKPVGRVYI
jgi:chaperonin cofactor prefoldin